MPHTKLEKKCFKDSLGESYQSYLYDQMISSVPKDVFRRMRFSGYWLYNSVYFIFLFHIEEHKDVYLMPVLETIQTCCVSFDPH